jgi:putative transcriptional regulator
MNKSLFEDLMTGLNEAVEHSAGKRELRTTTLPRPPNKMANTEIIAIRNSLKFSQAIFAAGLNVSKRTVEAWEQGKREPDGATLKLLSIAATNPEAVFGRK